MGQLAAVGIVMGKPLEPDGVLLAAQVRALLRDLRAQAALLPDLVRRLERCADQLVGGRLKRRVNRCQAAGVSRRRTE